MATNTSHLKLTKPDYADSADIGVINGNMDTLDEEIWKRSRVYNKLDNSNFAMPVNLLGNAEYSGTGYTIDRWKSTNARLSVKINDGYITLTSSGGVGYLRQLFEKPITNGKYTLAACVRGTGKGSMYFTTDGASSGCGAVTLNGGSGWTIYTVACDAAGGTAVPNQFSIRCDAEQTFDVLWAALYEGEYTADTLPEYIQDDYAQEFAACARECVVIPKYQVLNGFVTGSAKEVWVSIFLPAPMRSATPEIEMLPQVILRGINGYSALTPSSTDAITPTSMQCTAENVQTANVLRLRMFFDSAIETNNTPISVLMQSKCVIRAEP